MVERHDLIGKEYIGDAVYVDFDGFYFMLTTENGLITTNEIGLEPSVWAKLQSYVERTTQLIKDKVAEAESVAQAALTEEQERGPDAYYDSKSCTNPSCVDGLAPRKTGPDDGDVDMEPCPVCGGPNA